jgi:hypothetical protein
MQAETVKTAKPKKTATAKTATVKPATKKNLQLKPRLPDTLTAQRNLARGFHYTEFPAGKLRLVNVASRLLLRNLGGEQERLPVMCVRDADNADTAYAFEEVELLGPCEVLYTPDAPLPGTNGRGIAYMHTTAAIRGWCDPRYSVPPIENTL